MQPARRCTFLGALLVIAASRAGAAEVVIERIDATSQGYLFVEFELVEPFDRLYLEALRSGLPTRLSYTFELWRQRTGWWDRLERTDEREFRLFRNLLSDEYYAVSPDRTHVVAGLDSLVAATTVFRRDGLQRALTLPFPAPDLPENKDYYLVITVRLAPMSVEDLNELDEWLRGTFRGDDSGGISGLTRTMGGMLMSLTGFGDRTVHSRTPNFKPVDIRTEPIRLHEPRPPQPSVPVLNTTSPDDGGGR